MSSVFVKKFLSVCCLVSLHAGFAFSAEKKEVGLLLVGGNRMGKSSTINMIYNVMKGNDVYKPLDIIVPVRFLRRELIVNVDEYRERHSSRLFEEIGENSLIKKYIIENDDYKLTIYRAPSLDRGTRNIKGLIAIDVADILATEDIHGIGFVHSSAYQYGEVRDYEKVFSYLFTQDCGDHLFGVKTIADEFDEQIFTHYRPVGTNLRLDSYLVESKYLWIRDDSVRSNLFRESWEENSVASVQNMLLRVSGMPLVDKSKAKKKAEAENIIDDFVTKNKAKLKYESDLIDRFTGTKMHLQKIVSESGNSASVSDLQAFHSPGFQVFNNDSFRQLSKSWGVSSAANKLSQENSLREIDQIITSFQKKKAEFVKELEKPCEDLKALSFGGRSCKDVL